MLNVIYRLTGIASTNLSPIYQENKFKLNELCLKSFVAAFEDIQPKIHFILDHCDSRYEKLLLDCLSWSFTQEESSVGINETMLKAYKLGQEMDDYVLMQECDYLYKPKSGKILLEALKELDFVSPYDNLNFYKDRNLHSETCQIKLIGNHHFRTTERNTMTWGCHSDLLRENYYIFNKYGYLDGDVWYDLADKGYKLWVPVPSIATHMVKDYLSPNFEWEEICQNIQLS